MTKKPTVTTLASGFNSTETLNANFEALRDGFDNTLSLDGSTPNAMEADLDLNGNNIINASVIGTSSLVVNGKLISVSADPVFDGTVSVFGANLIADVDAAAVKTTLGLSTVASTGSYNDLSNQPSFASPAQGALADSAVQPTDTQATSAWTTGTSTTEGIVSPAKIKSAVESLLNLNSASANSYIVLNGLYIQWLSASITLDEDIITQIQFPIEFPNAVFNVFTTIEKDLSQAMDAFGIYVRTKSTTSAVLRVASDAGTNYGTGTVHVLAIGN